MPTVASTERRHGVASPAEKVAVWLIGALLIWSALPFGSVTRQWTTLVELGAFLAAAAAIVSPRSSKLLTRDGIAPLLVAAGLLSIALQGFVQSRDLPASWVRLVSSEHARLYEAAAAAAAASDGVPPANPLPPLTMSLSVATDESSRAALYWAALAAGLIAAAMVAGTKRARRGWTCAIVAAAAFQILYGMLNLGSASIWGVEVAPELTRLRGTFVNANHLALFLSMSLCLVFAWGFVSWWRTRDGDRWDVTARALALPAAMWLALFCGLAFTGSRAGLVAAFIAIGVQGLLLAWMLRRRKAVLLGAAMSFGGVLLVTLVGAQQGLGRFVAVSGGALSLEGRLATYRDTLDLWRQFPVLGSGLGTFREAFPTVQSVGSEGVWHHAHNDVLELLATTGLLGAALASVAAAVALGSLSKRLRSGARSLDRAAALAALGGLVAVAVHSLFDFGVTIPANAWLLAVMVGAGLGVPGSELKKRE